jgi:hypothetical protein
MTPLSPRTPLPLLPAAGEPGWNLPENCPIRQDTARIEKISQDMLKALRRLRRDLQACQKCPNADGCAMLESFNAVVQAAIQEVQDEWNQASG